MLTDWLRAVSESTIVIIDAIAWLAIVIGTIQLIVRVVRAELGKPTSRERREIWLGYARWLIAALTLQLAADIIETSISTSWEALGRLAAIAVIRTFLEYFLGRDIAEVHDREIRAKGDSE